LVPKSHSSSGSTIKLPQTYFGVRDGEKVPVPVNVSVLVTVYVGVKVPEPVLLRVLVPVKVRDPEEEFEELELKVVETDMVELRLGKLLLADDMVFDKLVLNGVTTWTKLRNKKTKTIFILFL